MSIIDYIDLYLGSLLNMMFCVIIVKKVFGIKMIENKRTRRVAHSYKSKTRLGGFCYKSYTINKDICQSFLKLTFLLNPDFLRIANCTHGRHAV